MEDAGESDTWLEKPRGNHTVNATLLPGDRAPYL
jgi:hypothetical protein